MKRFVIICLLILFTQEAHAKTGLSGWWIFRRPQSTTPKALVTVAAVRGDLSGVIYNPSLCATMNQREVFFFSEIGIGDDAFGGLLYGQPLGSNSGVAVGVVHYDSGRVLLSWSENGVLKSREVTAQRDTLGTISYGRELNRFFVGATLKFATSTIAEKNSAQAYAMDLGSVFQPREDLWLSLVGQNIGFSTEFKRRREELPTSLSLGGSYLIRVKGRGLNLNTELPYIIIEKRLTPSVGLGFITDIVSVNLGYRFNVEEAILHIGAGISLKGIDLGYAFIPGRYLPNTHRLTVGYRF